MQPTYDESSNSDTGRWDSAPGVAPGHAPPAPVDTVTKARPWLIALWSFVAVLVVIAAASNQWVVDAVQRHSNANTLGDHLARLVQVYAWRFSPPGGHDVGRFWVAGLAADGTTLVLTLLLVAVVARGFGRFWQTFFAAWFVVVVATLLGGYVRAAVIDQHQSGLITDSKADAILFSPLSPGTSAILAGLVVGVVVAFLAAVVAVATRRSNLVAAVPPPSFGVPWSRSDDDDDDRPWQSGPVPEHTAQLPAVEQARADDPTAQHAPPSAGQGDDATTQLPRHGPPPADER